MAAPEHAPETVADDGRTTQHVDKHPKSTGAAFLASVAGISMLFGFGGTVAMAKKSDPAMFNKGMVGSRTVPESGVGLATRALGWGTLYAFAGVGALCFGVWKILGVHNMQEFTAKVQTKMPRIPKHEPQGRSEFKSVRELIDYIITEDERKKSDQDR